MNGGLRTGGVDRVVTPASAERVRWPDAPLCGFAALGTENLHAPRALGEPDLLPDAPTTRAPTSSDEATRPDTMTGGEVSTALAPGSEVGMLDADVY